MHPRPLLPALLALLLACSPARAAEHVPPRQDWARIAPADAGFDPRKLGEAVTWAREHGEQVPADLTFWTGGSGGNPVYVDREHDVVIVARWTPDIDGVSSRVLDALRAR